MNEYLSRLTQFAENTVGRIKLKSALNGCLWLIGITFPVGLWFLAKITGPIQWAVFCLLALPFIFFGISHLHFTFRDPDKLRSEDYELRKQALELIEEKGGQIPIAESSIEVIANPNYPTLLEGKEDDQNG